MSFLDVLVSRSSVATLVEPAPAAEVLDKMFAAAVSAPDHGRLRPWRFIVIEGTGLARLGDVMAEALRRREPGCPEAKLAAERKKPLRAPMIVVAAAVMAEHPGVPKIEQIVAVGAAVENLLLAAHALGYGGFWRTGAAAHDPEVKRQLGLAAADEIVGFIYLGTAGAATAAARKAEAGTVVRRWPA